jgi:hypothetical protein
MARASLGNVIHTMITSQGDRGEKCALLALVHKLGNREQEVMRVLINSASPVDPEETAAMFRGRAESHAQDLPGLQYYCVLAFYADKSEPFTRQSFKIAGEEDSYGLATEGPTPTGLVQQHMRHLEGMTRISQLHTEQLFDKMHRMNEMLMNQNVKLMEEQGDVLDLAKQLIMEKATEQHKHEMEIKKYERISQHINSALKILPPLVNTLTGREVFPQSTADTALVDSLAETITEEQVGKLAQILTPQQLGLFAARMEKTLKDKREAKEQALLGAANGRVSDQH